MTQERFGIGFQDGNLKGLKKRARENLDCYVWMLTTDLVVVQNMRTLVGVQIVKGRLLRLQKEMRP
jgi:hypothetical protein